MDSTLISKLKAFGYEYFKINDSILLARDNKDIYLFKDGKLEIDIYKEYKDRTKEYMSMEEHNLAEWNIRVYKLDETIRIECESPYYQEYNGEIIYISIDTNCSIIKDSYLFECSRHWICADNNSILYYNKENRLKSVITLSDEDKKRIGESFSIKDMLYNCAICVDSKRDLMVFEDCDGEELVVDFYNKVCLPKLYMIGTRDFVIYTKVATYGLDDVTRRIRYKEFDNESYLYNNEIGLCKIKKIEVYKWHNKNTINFMVEYEYPNGIRRTCFTNMDRYKIYDGVLLSETYKMKEYIGYDYYDALIYQSIKS